MMMEGVGGKEKREEEIFGFALVMAGSYGCPFRAMPLLTMRILLVVFSRKAREGRTILHFRLREVEL
jgi:hypothetical protein